MAKQIDSLIDNSLNLTQNVLGFLSAEKAIAKTDSNVAMKIDYDKEADVLYISFRKPQHATTTIETDDDILIRKDGNKVVGITIMHASKRPATI